MKNNLFVMCGVIALSVLSVGCSPRHAPKETSSVIGVIGGSDGPTSIYVQEDTSDFLLQRGLEVIEKMCILAKDSTYIHYCTQNADIISRVKHLAFCHYHSGYKVFEIVFSPAFLKKKMTGRNKETSDKLFFERFCQSIPMWINAYAGSANVAAISMLACEEVFHCHTLAHPCFYLYRFEQGIDCMVWFVPRKESIVQSYATFLVHERLADLKTANELKAFFSEMIGVAEIEVKEIN